MFTGIIEGLGRIAEIQIADQGKRFAIDADFNISEMHVGDSIAVNGACLTVTEISGHRFKADASPETLTTTTMSLRKIGDRVNLERALRFSDRLDGHLVSGHVDGLGTITQKKQMGNAIIFTFKVSQALSDYIIQKGSVAVDGISLTVNACDMNSFEVSIIPHTAKETTISQLKSGDTVNIETDMIGKYVKRFMPVKDKESDISQDKQSIDMAFLAKTGFI